PRRGGRIVRSAGCGTVGRAASGRREAAAHSPPRGDHSLPCALPTFAPRRYHLLEKGLKTGYGRQRHLTGRLSRLWSLVKDDSISGNGPSGIALTGTRTNQSILKGRIHLGAGGNPPR